MRRGYYAKKDLEKNARLKLSDIKYVRPAGKNSINNLNEILDKKIKNNIKVTDKIDLQKANMNVLILTTNTQHHKYFINKLREKILIYL